MSFSSWLRFCKSALSGGVSSNRRSRRKHRSLCRPCLGVERLEDRTLLSAGVLDPTFGQNGQVLTNFVGSGNDQANTVLVNNNTGIVTEVGNSGGYGAIALASYHLADGTRNTAFGTNGEVSTTGLGRSLGGALQADGKIVAAGSLGVARYNTDGSLDSSFGGGSGKVIFSNLNLVNFDASSTAVQGNQILVAGQQYNYSIGNWGFAVARLNGDGSLDTSFGVNGVATADFHNNSDYARSVTVAPDGSIALAGQAYNPASGKQEFAVARFTAKGQLDSGFNGIGTQALAMGNNAYASTAAFEADGSGGYKLVVGGYGYNNGGASGTALVRFNANGSLDSTFGQGGKVLAGDGYQVQNLVVQADGKIVTADNGVRLSRYNVDGSLDNFGSGGHVYSYPAYNYAVALSGNSILASGFVYDPYGSTGNDFSLAKYTSGGNLDYSFNGTGTARADFTGDRDDQGRSILVDGLGRIVEVGSSDVGSAIALTRVNSDGTRDTTFGSNGQVVTTGIGPGTGGALQADGKIVAVTYSGIARYNTDGSLDSSFGGGTGKILFSNLNLGSFYPSLTAVQGNQILVAGRQYNNSTGNWIFAVTRLNGTGDLDTSFGVKGVAIADFYYNSSVPQCVAVASDNSIALAGYAYNPASGKQEFAVARFTDKGQLDSGFNGIGTQALAMGNNAYAYTAAFEADGSGGYKLAVGGYGPNAGGTYGTALVRFNANGSLDSTFGQGGKVLAGDYNLVQNLVVQADGKIVTADLSGLSRYNADGSLDTNFGPGGHVYSYDYNNRAVALTSDGFILVGGSRYNNNTNTGNDFSLLRYTGVNHAPTADDGGPYTINAFDSLALNGSGSDPDNDSLNYTWTINGHTHFGAKPTLSWSALQNDGIVAGQTYSVTLQVNDGFGGITTTDTTLQVNKLTPSVSVSVNSGTYTGSSFTATATVTGADHVARSSLDGVSPTLHYEKVDAQGNVTADLGSTPPRDAGSYTVTVNFAGSSNYSSAQSQSTSFTIAKADAVISVFGYSATYDGSSHTSAGSAIGVESSPVNLISLLHLGGTSHINAGTYSGDSWTFDGNANYNSSSGTVADSIAKAPSSIAGLDNVTTTYDGTAHGETAPAVTGAGGLNTTATLSYHKDGTLLDSAPVNAGSYSVVARYAGDDNHEAAPDVSAAITINKADASVIATPVSGTYSGSAYQATVTAGGVGGADLSSRLSFDAPLSEVNAGHYAIHWSLAGGENYHDQTGSTTIDIAKASSAIANIDNVTATYDGNAHGVTAPAVTAAGGLSTSATLAYYQNGALLSSPPVNAGSFTVVARYDGDDNHETAAEVSATITINKATPTVNVLGGTFIYDGKVHPATGSITGVNGTNQGTPVFTYSYTDKYGNVVQSTNPPVNPGYYTVTASFAGDSNYQTASNTAIITIAFEANSLTDLGRAFNAGRTIPIKVALKDAAGNNLSSSDISVAAVKLERVNADGSRTRVTLADAGNSNPMDLFRYDANLGGYIFNLSTKGLTAGSYVFSWMAGNDPSTHELSFGLV